MSWRSKYDEIERLEAELQAKLHLASELEAESQQLLRRERLLKIQVRCGV